MNPLVCTLEIKSLFFGSNAVEIVNQWTHLGHIIDNRCDHGADISFRRNSTVDQINNVLCYFNQVDAAPKVKLPK